MRGTFVPASENHLLECGELVPLHQNPRPSRENLVPPSGTLVLLIANQGPVIRDLVLLRGE